MHNYVDDTVLYVHDGLEIVNIHVRRHRLRCSEI